MLVGLIMEPEDRRRLWAPNDYWHLSRAMKDRGEERVARSQPGDPHRLIEVDDIVPERGERTFARRSVFDVDAPDQGISPTIINRVYPDALAQHRRGRGSDRRAQP